MLDVLKKRDVEFLVHFTRLENLISIMRHGLLSRASLEKSQISSFVNDAYRFDHLMGAISLSVSYPNYRMFFRCRVQNPGTDWIVIRLKPRLINNHICIYCYKNAASREISELSVEGRGTKSALESMFQDHDGMPSRDTLNLEDHFATDPQAEILVLDDIDPSYIVDVAVDRKIRLRNPTVMRQVQEQLRGTVKFCEDPAYFNPRSDYLHWRD